MKFDEEEDIDEDDAWAAAEDDVVDDDAWRTSRPDVVEKCCC